VEQIQILGLWCFVLLYFKVYVLFGKLLYLVSFLLVKFSS